MKSIKENQALIAWPGASNFKYSAKLSILFFLIFYALFATTDYIASLHSYRVDAYFDFELMIPKVTWMSLIYLSISPFLLLAPFIIRDKNEFKAFFNVMLIETIIASIFFLSFPVEVSYPEQLGIGFFEPFYIFADKINLTYNELPSLHVAFAYTAAITFKQKAKKTHRTIIMTWANLIAISTILTHQHHLLGAFSGILLAVLTLKLFEDYNKTSSINRN